jgi:hypothetical protein
MNVAASTSAARSGHAVRRQQKKFRQKNLFSLSKIK